jgi:hypothetical protein
MGRRILYNENNTKTPLRFKVCDQEDDAESIVGLAREAHAQSRFGYIQFCEAKVRNLVEKALLSPKRQGILLAYKGNTLVGGARTIDKLQHDGAVLPIGQLPVVDACEDYGY